MKVEYKGNTLEVSYSFSDDNENAFDVYVCHKYKEVAEEVLYLIADIIGNSSNTYDVDCYDDIFNISTTWFFDGDEDKIEDWKSDWVAIYKKALQFIKGYVKKENSY